MEKRFENYAKLAATIILVAGCFLVLRPFLSAILFAAVVCISTWPSYTWLLQKMKGRRSLAALIMTTSLSLLLILPLALLVYTLTDNLTGFYDEIQKAVQVGLPKEPPAWLAGLPVAGEYLADYWRNLATGQEDLLGLAQRFLNPLKDLLLASGIMLGKGVIQLTLAAFTSFFLYRDGEKVLLTVGVLEHAVGAQGTRVIEITTGTVRGVMLGLLGTALAQGIVALIGFSIAGVPAPLLLGAATALLSLVPVGPPLIWGGAAIWLFRHGETGWGIFMLLWGFFLISTVDNVVKPLLISRGSNLPLLLVVLGVMGGVLAFGFVGIFVGPVLLAVALNLIQQWTAPV